MYTHHNTTRLITGCIICCLLLVAISLRAHAASPSVYDVEVIFFLNNASNDTGEPQSNARQGGIRTGALSGNQFTELARSQYNLNGVRSKLESSGKYSILLHRAWRQTAYGNSRAVAYPLHSIAANGRDKLDGSITLVRERYLHLDVDALLQTAPRDTGMEYSGTAAGYPVFELNEKRRIKTSELNYFDHPRFGMIAQVTPYTTAKSAPEPVDNPASTTEQIQREIDKQVSESSPADNQLTR